MERVPSHPVLTCPEARAWEKARLTSESLEWSAMQSAGAKVALSILEDFMFIKDFNGNGVTRVEIREVLLQVAIYCGIPAGVDAFRVAKEAIAEFDKTEKK